MTNDDKALVKRLRSSECITYYDGEPGIVADEELPNETADRIEALSAENERLRVYLSSAIETLRDAEVCGDDCGFCNDARAALGDKQ